jgi:type I restriction enzyme S subunit
MIKFPSYQKINIPWIGDIPTGWSLKSLKHIFSEKKSTKNSDLGCGSISFGKVIYKDDEKIPESTKESYQEVLDGEFLINPLNLNYDLKSLRIGLSKINVVVSQGYIVLKIKDGFVPKYYEYFLRKFDVEYMKSLGQGVRQTISYLHIKDEKLVVPPFEEQNRIARYLDKKTGQIDLLINKIEKKIELLKEQRNSMINQYVTKGVESNIEMKDSGIDWIGEIPKHWKLGKIKYLSTLITKGTTPSNIGEDFDENGEVRFLKGEDLLDGTLIEDGKTFISNKVNQKLKRSQLEKGDLLVVIAGTLGKCAVVSETVLPANTNQALSLVRFKEDVNSHFVRYWFETSSCKNQISEFAVVAAQPNLSMEDLGSIKVPIVEKNEQKEIIRLISQKESLINKEILLEVKRLKLLQEYRQTLISSVVTGKVKVKRIME